MTLNAIIANFQTFKLVDLLDIIIISFLIYQLLGIVNRTRAGQLFKGALLVMAVYLVAETLNMRTVTWLLNSLLQVGLLTLVVLFQPEIRRALERMGQTDQWAAKLFNVKGRYNDPSLKGAWRSAIIAICDAAERFSETKTGALIVLERHTNLSEIVRTGTPVNSAVNLEVLVLPMLHIEPPVRYAQRTHCHQHCHRRGLAARYGSGRPGLPRGDASRSCGANAHRAAPRRVMNRV